MKLYTFKVPKLKIPVIDDLELEKQNMHEHFAFSKISVADFLKETVLF